jgi:hypothetical protein
MRPRIFFLASSFAAMAAIGAACATGSGSGDLGGNDDDDDESPSGSGGSGAAGGESSGKVGGASSSSTASTGGTASVGGSGGGPACTEEPCKLVAPQCGCPADQQCVIGATSPDNPGGRACSTGGTTPPGEPCANNADCQAGSMCVNTGVNLCMEFCADDAACNAPGGQCLITLVDSAMQTIPDAVLCSLNCDPITNTGCSAGGCALGQEEVSMELFTLCQGAGAGTQGSVCADNGDCAGGYGCFDLECLKYCGVNPAKGSCTGGTLCSPFTTPVILGAQEYGVCI